MEMARFLAEIEQLHPILEWVEHQLKKKGLKTDQIRRIELAIEEMIVNIINHGYAKRQGKIEIGLEESLGRLEIRIRDWGPPFDPLTQAPKVNPHASLEERGDGGLGIYLMRQIMDELFYQREEDTNLLIMVKHFSQKK